MTSCEEPVEGSYFVSTYPPFSAWGEARVEDYQAALSREVTGDVPLGLYAHIPFCELRCSFCYYLSQANPDSGRIESYLDCLELELAHLAATPALRQRELSFLYFGGGTPSMLSADQIRRLMAGLEASFRRTKDAEVTFECAPRTTDLERLQVLRDHGVTRLSMGIQQLDDTVLRENSRVHSVHDVEAAMECIATIGFDVVNLDLIVGLAGETDETFFRSLERVIAMGAQSVTLYQLEIPFNTPLARAVRRGRTELALPSWDTKRRRLEAAFQELEKAGYTVRSAYAAVRDPGAHRFVYQEAQYRGADLLGVGASAFSYIGGVHHQNIASTGRYMACVSDGDLPLYRAHALSDDEQVVREFVLQLKTGGCCTRPFRERFGVNLLDRFSEPLAHFREIGWIETVAGEINVTRAGLLHVDRMIPAFYDDRYKSIRYF
jgi:oxygen-independent coproporphyrinogen-3 oxidase